jgi:predicted TIM-barrel fold metal-dependent hydrolase
MANVLSTRSAELKSGLDHPVIDVDGHYIEVGSVLEGYAAEFGGPELASQVRTIFDAIGGYFKDESDWKTRRDRGDSSLPIFWSTPTTNTLDRATALIPRLLHERLGDFGIDFSILYPTYGLNFPHIADEAVRIPMCRAFNHYAADMFRPYGDRLTPAALIPLHTPEEGIRELEYAVHTLGLKAAMIPTYVRRPPRALADRPEWAYHASTLDCYGLESDYDYDPFWAKCVELQVLPATHSTGMGWGSRRSYGNFMYNHVGHFAEASHALCKSLVLGGVTKRFPGLRLAFLECGVAWAASLYSDMIAHWKKRNPAALERDLDPQKVDTELLMQLIEKYGDKRLQSKSDQACQAQNRWQPRPERDDWAALGISTPEEFRSLFEPNFYFGCEADDPMNALAFRTEMNPYGARLRAVLSSDISHWDVVDMTTVLEEAYELVEDGHISTADFRDFTFLNAVRGFAGVNPLFFAGTAIEGEVKKALAAV